MEPEINKDPEMPSDEHGAEIAAVIFASIICAIVAYVFGFGHNVRLTNNDYGLIPTDKPEVIQQIDPFTFVSLQAKSAYVWDVQNQKVLFAKNADQILPLASIAKIMTADVASEILAPTSTISIDSAALAQDGDNGLMLNERWTFKKLLDFTLAVSSNDGAYAIATTASPNFIDIMNQKAQSLGLTSMQFFNPTGLDLSLTRSGAYSSAADVAKLFAYTLQNHPEVFAATRYARFTTSSLDNINHTAVNTDAEINNIPGIIGSKTGYTDLAGGNLAVVYDASLNYPIIVVVLGSTYDGRFSDVQTLIQASISKFVTTTDFAKWPSEIGAPLCYNTGNYMVIIDVVKIFIAATLSFFIGIAITPAITSYLYSHHMWKKKSGKNGLDGKGAPIFNELHKEKEVGTPRMGGVIIWLSAAITIVGLWLLAEFFPNSITTKLDFLSRNQTWIPFVTMLIGALVGLVDDFFEISGKFVGGLSLKKRLIVVGLVSLVFGVWFYARLGVDGIGTPWGALYLGWLIVPFFILLSMFLYSGGIIDGIDGLAGGVFSIIFSAYGIIAIHQQQINLATFCFSLTGAILAFLWFNIPPARFYMSETGSMALTLALSVVVFMTGTPKNGYGIFVLPIVALPLIITTLSVIIQMLSKKLRAGKKIFLVAPLHHHFEAKGWPSYKVTMRYWILTIIFAIIGVTIAFLGKPL